MRSKSLLIGIMVVALTFVLATCAVAQVTGAVAVVLRIRGELELKKADQEQWVPSAPGDSLYSGDGLKTGVGSLAAIKFMDGSIVKMRGNTELTIQAEETPEGTTSKRVFLGIGDLWAKAVLQAGPFEVETPTSVAAIKGTEFYLSELAGWTVLHVLEGLVELTNPLGSVLVGAGFSAVSTITEAPSSFSPTLEELPTWAELLEEVVEVVPEVPPPPEEVPPPPEEVPPKPGRPGFAVQGTIGTAVMDGKLWNMISFRPDIPIWKFGVGLDLTFYIDQDGNIREKDWDEFGDILDKIYYVRFGQLGEPLYVRAGALPSVTLGYGLIMEGYSNTIEYPTTKRVGVQVGIRRGQMGFDGMVNNIREFGVIGGRIFYRPHRFLEFGATAVWDRNQYAGLSLKDQDGDGVIDEMDGFPDDADKYKDSDGDGLVDSEDIDADGDNLYDPSDASVDTLANVFNYKEAEAEGVLVYGFDVGVPLIEKPGLNAVLYGQFAKINGAGSGFAAPGLKVGVGPVRFILEYRNFQDKFLSSYFDQTYELERVKFRRGPSPTDSIEIITKKEETLDKYPALKGIYSALGFSLLDMINFQAIYQDLRGSPGDRSFSAQANLYPIALPKMEKLTKVSGFYRQYHVEELFELRTESTVWGYQLGYRISPGLTLLVTQQTTYVDLDGDGDVTGPGEEVKTTTIETVISF